MHLYNKNITRTPSQYPKRRLSVRSRKVSKPRDLYLELSDRSAIWQALRQQCCRCACQILKRYDNLKYQSRGFETLRDLTKRRLFGYWDGALENDDPVHRRTYGSSSLNALTRGHHHCMLRLLYKTCCSWTVYVNPQWQFHVRSRPWDKIPIKLNWNKILHRCKIRAIVMIIMVEMRNQ